MYQKLHRVELDSRDTETSKQTANKHMHFHIVKQGLRVVLYFGTNQLYSVRNVLVHRLQWSLDDCDADYQTAGERGRDKGKREGWMCVYSKAFTVCISLFMLYTLLYCYVPHLLSKSFVSTRRGSILSACSCVHWYQSTHWVPSSTSICENRRREISGNTVIAVLWKLHEQKLVNNF